MHCICMYMYLYRLCLLCCCNSTVWSSSHHKHARPLSLRYVKWSLAYELPDAYRFWDALEEALKAVAAEDVQFTNGLRKTDLRDLGKSSLNASDIGKAFVNVAKRIRKHLPQNEGLARQVCGACVCNVCKALCSYCSPPWPVCIPSHRTQFIRRIFCICRILLLLCLSHIIPACCPCFLFFCALSLHAQQVWMAVEAHFRTRFRRFQQLVAQCYQSERLLLRCALPIISTIQ